MMTLGSLFDGIGGFPLAAVHCGGVPVWASEIEPFPMRVTKLRFPDMIHVGDITKLDGAKLPPVDVICGGSPCQDLSVAGLRKGLAGERSGLFMDQVRIVKEMRAEDERRGVSDDFIRPRYLVWENVPGAFSSANGEDFRAVIEEIVHIKDSTCHVPRPDTGRWESAGAAILGDQFSFRCLSCGHQEICDWTIYRYDVHNQCKNCGRYYRVDIEDTAKQHFSVLHVACPYCGAIMSGEVHKTAEAFSYIADIQNGREPYFGLELWFLTSFQGKPVWALNREHLAYLIDYLSADLREKPPGRAKKTQADHLPTFMKTAKNRERIVKLLKKM